MKKTLFAALFLLGMSIMFSSCEGLGELSENQIKRKLIGSWVCEGYLNGELAERWSFVTNGEIDEYIEFTKDGDYVEMYLEDGRDDNDLYATFKDGVLYTPSSAKWKPVGASGYRVVGSDEELYLVCGQWFDLGEEDIVKFISKDKFSWGGTNYLRIKKFKTGSYDKDLDREDYGPLAVTFEVPNKVYVGDAVTLEAQVSGGKTPYTYKWTIANVEQEKTNAKIVYTFTQSGTAKVVLDVTDAKGATAQEKKVVVVQPGQEDASVVSLPATNINQTNATLNGMLTSSTAANLSKDVWFLVSRTAKTTEALKQEGQRVLCDLDEDGHFEYNLYNLSPETEYYYIAGASLGSSVFYGDVLSFTTLNQLQPNLRTDWTIQYKGRANYTETNGSVSSGERFHIEAPGNVYYLIRTINPEVFDENYGTDVIEFLKDEQSNLERDAQFYHKKVTDYLYNQTPQDIVLDRIHPGGWKAFLIGFDVNGKITGDYAHCAFTVHVSEEFTSAFAIWLGDWKISGQDSDGHTVSYDITISASEANYAYFVDKWETGPSIDNYTGTVMQREGDWFEAFYEPSNGNIYFRSQFIQRFKEYGYTYYQFFFGNFYYAGRLVEKGEYIFPELGYDIAEARMIKNDNTMAEVTGCSLTAYMTDTDPGYTTQFTSMQYFADDGNQQLKFNLNVPQFPLTMIKTGSSPSSTHALVRNYKSNNTSFRQHPSLRDVQCGDRHVAKPAVAKQTVK